jgi:hypothetical protein
MEVCSRVSPGPLVVLLAILVLGSMLPRAHAASATPPTAAITAPASGSVLSGSRTISATAADADGIMKVRFWVDSLYLGYDSTAPYSKPWDTTRSVNGTRTIKIEALDLLGASTIVTETVVVANIDPLPPTVVIDAPAAFATVDGQPTFAASASDNVGVQKVRFWVDGVYLGYDSAPPYARTWDTNLFANGPHTLKVQALDNANNSSIATRSVSVLHANPTPTITPIPSATASATVTSTATDTPTSTATSTPSPTATPTPVTLGFLHVRPWAVLQSTFDAAGNGALITLKYDATGAPGFNLLPVSLDGSGSAAYGNAVAYGSTAIVCAAGTTNCATASCPGAYPAACAETSPSCDGPDCTTQTGNLVGPTRTGIDTVMTNTSADCDTFAEAFTANGGGAYDLNAACDPGGAGACASTSSVCSRRIFIVPIVGSFPSGAGTVTIQAFATFWLEGYSGPCTGSACDVSGRFVNATYAGP